MVKSYLVGMPFEAVLIRAGHPSDCFLCARADVPIPSALMELASKYVFPFATEMVENYKQVLWHCLTSQN